VIGEHVLRHAGGRLIDTPDLPPLSTRGAVWRYVATLWPDRYERDGWGALVWDPAERGYFLPPALAVGDVIEFGIAVLASNGRKLAEHRWWGWLDHSTDRALIVHGPYEHPTPAHVAARPTIDEVRLTQLDPPHDAAVAAGGHRT
jgi:hypothetical protein